MNAITQEEARETLCAVDHFEHIASVEWVEDRHQAALAYLIAKGLVEPFTQYRLTKAGHEEMKAT